MERIRPKNEMYDSRVGIILETQVGVVTEDGVSHENLILEGVLSTLCCPYSEYIKGMGTQAEPKSIILEGTVKVMNKYQDGHPLDGVSFVEYQIDEVKGIYVPKDSKLVITGEGPPERE